MSEAGIGLFVYGTLRQREVQRAVFGREVESRPDALPGFATETVAIRNLQVISLSGLANHLIAEPTGRPTDRIEGLLLRLTPAELAAADAYETADYSRLAVTLASGIGAYVYGRTGDWK